jgi:hypothetical protein
MRIAAFLCLAVLAAAGCSAPASRQFDESVQRVASNASTMNMLAEAWCEGRIPLAYAVRTADLAHKNLGHLAESMQSVGSVAADRRDTAVRLARTLQAWAEHTHAALERGDRQAVESALGELRLLESEARRQAQDGMS